MLPTLELIFCLYKGSGGRKIPVKTGNKIREKKVKATKNKGRQRTTKAKAEIHRKLCVLHCQEM